jgi:hypothetical protein
MKLLSMLALSVVSVLSSLSGEALAEQDKLREQLIGSWIFVSAVNTAPDGTRRELFGPNPKGILILDASGWCAQVLAHPDRPKFKGTRLEGTAEENKAIVQGTTAIYGTWSVDEANKTLVIHIEAALWPNEEGMDQRRPVTLAGDELKFINPAPTAGGRGELVLRRARR